MSIQETMVQEALANEEIQATASKSGKYPIVELFGPVIQGEGALIGTKTMFIRFGGCDYRCQKCDSLHAVMPRAVKANAQWMTSEEIFLRLLEARQTTGVNWVTYSGGNPCMHDVSELTKRLQDNDFAIAVETQGTIIPKWLPYTNIVTVSPKSPGMGETFEEGKFSDFIRATVASGVVCVLKVVVFSQQDIEFALEVGDIAMQAGLRPAMRFLSLGNPNPPILGQDMKLHDEQPGEFTAVPRDRDEHVKFLLNDYRSLCDDILSDSRVTDWKFLPQLHVLLYGNEASR